MRMYDNGTYRDMTCEEEAEHVKANSVGEEVALTRYANSITGASDQTLVEAAETLIIYKIKEES